MADKRSQAPRSRLADTPESAHRSIDGDELRGGTAPSLMKTQRWRRLMPIVFITYSFAYLDRGNYSLGAAGGLEKSLHIDSFQAGLLGGLFFIGYFFFQVPAATFAENKSVKKLLFWALILWGIFAAAQGVIPWYWLLLVNRFLLGVVEAAVIPALLVFLMHWFSTRERGRTNSFLILGHPVTLLWMSVASGYLIAALNWHWMFIIEGLPAIVWAVVFRFVVDDRPSDADWLNDAERKRLEKRLEAEDESDSQPKMRQRDVFKSRKVVMLAVMYGLWSIGVYGLVFWMPTMIKSMTSSGIGTTGLLTAAPYAFATIMMIIVSWVSDHTGLRRWVVMPCLVLGAFVFVGSSFLGGANHFVVAWILLIVVAGLIYAPYGPFFAFIPELLPRRVAGVGIGAINAIGGLGGFIGPTVVGWLGGDDKSSASFLFMAACLFVSGLLMLVVRRPSGGAVGSGGGEAGGEDRTRAGSSEPAEKDTAPSRP